MVPSWNIGLHRWSCKHVCSVFDMSIEGQTECSCWVHDLCEERNAGVDNGGTYNGGTHNGGTHNGSTHNGGGAKLRREVHGGPMQWLLACLSVRHRVGFEHV